MLSHPFLRINAQGENLWTYSDVSIDSRNVLKNGTLKPGVSSPETILVFVLRKRQPARA